MRTFGEAPPPPTFFERLKEGLSRSTGGLSANLTGIFTKRKLDKASVAELEEALIRADLGAGLAARIAGAVARNRYDQEITESEIRDILSGEITDVLKKVQKPLVVDSAHKPFVVLVAGVNGGGKLAAWSTQRLGSLVTRLQSGNLRSYAGWLAAGAAAVLLLAYFGFGTHLALR